MALVNDVAARLGITYVDAGKTAELNGMIKAAQTYFASAGWDCTAPDWLGIEAIVLWCKMAQSTDPATLTNHPVLTAMIAQGRAGAADDD